MEQPASFREHFNEFKDQLKPAAYWFIAVFAAGYYLAQPVLQYIKNLVGLKVIAIHPYEIFVTRVEIGFYLALIVTLPMISTQVIRFFKPAFTEKEYIQIKKYIPLLFTCSILGLTVGTIFLTEMATGFLQGLATGTGIENTWTISNITSYIAKLSLATSLIFNIPVVVILLNKTGAVELPKFKKYRKHALIGSVLTAALLSPPDFFSMMFLALPSYGFYEGGIKLAAIL